ncbi:MAG TPA: hypothetical protein VF599_25120 [Pyrinomonadaceae bacterium]|jgi:hypothetical protein
MSLYKKCFWKYLTAILFAVFVFSGPVYSQFTVSICGAIPPGSCGAAATIVPESGSVNITVTVTQTSTENLDKLVIYRNDVPYMTFDGTSYSRTITETELGQDTYTYHARAYGNGVPPGQVDSSDFELTVDFPSTRVFKMGTTIGTINTPGPNRNDDHTDEINQALVYISNTGGGVLFFPCSGGPGDGLSIYNISGTINVPSNVTLQGESAREGFIDASCRMYWNKDLTSTGCWNPTNISQLQDLAMFEIAGTKERIRFKDLSMVTRYRGRDCTEGETSSRIVSFNNKAILLDAQSEGSISDIIFENVSINTFKYGIQALGKSISDVKMRGVTPFGNYRQLSINATFAYDWDIQNLNFTGMLDGQGGVEIIHASYPEYTPAERQQLRFLQLNCNGNAARTPAFCIEINKHGGLYFKQLHVEGAQKSIVVNDVDPNSINLEPIVNNDPIILEHGVAVGEFHNASMKLFLIGTGMLAAPDPETVQEIPAPYRHVDTQVMEFYGNGWQSTVVDCGDMHGDRTDVRTYPTPGPSPTPTPTRPGWGDWKMQFSHTERNRESLFSLDSNNKFFPKPHTVCPANMEPQFPDINEVGGNRFNTGVMPVTKDTRYTNPFSCPSSQLNTPTFCTTELNNKLNSAPNGGTIQINGPVIVNDTIHVPGGRQIVGGVDGELILQLANPPTVGTRVNLLQIKTATRMEGGFLVPVRTSAITIRDLKLSTNQPVRTSGLAIVGTDNAVIGVSSDLHFSGLIIQGFDKGVDVRRYAPQYDDQMVDGVSWKNIRFVNNQIAAHVVPQNVSNWNIMELKMESDKPASVGWHHVNTGNSMQNVTCSGTQTEPMSDCIKLEMAGTHLSGLRKTSNVNNALTFAPNWRYFTQQYEAPVFANTVLRDNDFTGVGTVMGAVSFAGKAFITSMNNRYKNFNVVSGTADQGEYSRVTYCNDKFDSSVASGQAFPYLANLYNDLYVGVHLPTRIQCAKSNDLTVLAPKPWKDVVRWGAEPRTDSNPSDPFKADKPLVGNLMGSAAEDLVIFHEATYSEFRVRKFDGTDKTTIYWGTQHDIPFVGKFKTSTLDQAVIWRPSSGVWWFYDPASTTNFAVGWGLSCSAPYTNCDIPFTGNFIDESGSQGDNLNEIAIYRPSDYSIWIINPRSATSVYLGRTSDLGSQIQTGDFLNLGYDQIAQIKADTSNNLVWSIINPRSPYNTLSVTFGKTGDKLVAGRYLEGTCAQIAVWDPLTEEFKVTDAVTGCDGSSTLRTGTMKWGSNNDSFYTGTTTEPTECTLGICPDDIPLRIDLGDGIHRPTSYRPTSGIYPKSRAKGQWWIHDPFLQN